MTYLFFFLLFLGILINQLSKKYIFKNIYYSREISKKVLEIGEEFKLITTVENRKFFPVTFFQIEERLPSALDYKFKVRKLKTPDFLYHTISLFLLSYQKVKRIYSAYCNKRGRYIFGDVTLISGDFLGLNVVVKSLRLDQEIVVLPRRLSLEKDIIPYGSYNGNLSVRRWIIEDPTMIIGVREYTGQEPAKTIHWPLSLKHNRLMVKNFDYTVENTSLIILNIETFKPHWRSIDEEKIEKAISCARSCAERFEEENIPYGLMTNSILYGFPAREIFIPPGNSDYHLKNLLEHLGRVSYSISMSFEELIESLNKKHLLFSTYVIITPKILDSYIPYINSLKTELTEVILITFDPQNINHISNNILRYLWRGVYEA
ncbi:MAG: hypothetical protein CBR30_05675 [Dictyoglomus sp. NZ13-RE01]|nr:MAG: hypothetical protein CBR30_05675 [Dictyoglomus sp. NZ13-RE01]